MWRLLNFTLCNLPILAQDPLAPAPERPRIDPATRLQLMMALGLVVLLGGFAIMVIRATGRVVRWYGRDSRDYRFLARVTPDTDDWAQKPLLPPLDDSDE